MSQLFASGGQRIEVSASTSVMDWFDLFAVQGTLKSLLQHHHIYTIIIYLFWLQKLLQIVTAVMKLKDIYSLEEKWWPP